MRELRRITTEYIPVQDRLRLRGEVAPGEQVELWLTLRLMNRLLPRLLDWLARSQPPESHPIRNPDSVTSQAMQSFAQQAAVATLRLQAPVPHQPNGESWLVVEVTVSVRAQILSLTFKSAAEEALPLAVCLVMQARSLRQWLDVLYRQYQKADWPMHLWPAWITAAQQALHVQVPHALH